MAGAARWARGDGRIEQVQVSEAVGLTFPVVLRSMLGQDPNVLMIGEIRDAETAAIACRAALVGRLVLSTLYVSAPDLALTRLVDLGVEEFVARDVLVGVLGQSLPLAPYGVEMRASVAGSSVSS
ncbi:MAG: ATPase, T2SS/T4P/T4SS family [Paracoccaceae bacterium]|nr:ATPase, T2SS/T4P/T4SS family [Paracoccaceae bacterium]